MAVDTRLKRSSILGLTLASLAVLPAPDTAIALEDRVSLAYSYAGTNFSAIAGTISSDLNQLGQSVTGDVTTVGSATSDLNQLAQSATGTALNLITGTASNDLNQLGQSATGTALSLVTGTATSDLNQLNQSLSGFILVAGVATSDLNQLGQSAAGSGGIVVEVPENPRATTRKGRFTRLTRGVSQSSQNQSWVSF